ncbi:hypothetical protein M431DRAFT_532785 [Trichoderma harzianum CBS 226.95]|uniref:Zn(2)-C6 fungal-type domain-containing protein n=1 Tax=Trichoderma harzianum CBS 226.95 TaxID=983964 RepID=A0A2T4A596_TRIHA|nr:hypothetical protein M431DRAFT_532785 [Trichoderma harzianum CBS 226.95]PTB52208.1 hypothetical protein M431DRAFT_532785 [Trichoderma harzianum CBS 226.95]
MAESSVAAETAARACAACHKNKRRCDKSIPTCSLCKRFRRPCDYSGLTNGTDDSASLRSRISELEQQVARLSNQTPSTLSNFDDITAAPMLHDASSRLYVKSLFLDSGLSEYCIKSNPVVNVSIPQEVITAIGDQLAVDHIKTQYFRLMNTWMPILNEAKLDRLINPRSQNGLRPDTALLLLSMKLILEVPTNNDAERSPLYVISKKFCYTLDGLYTLTKLQATLIIAVYELGHAIFPAAYTSIGTCASHGITLGLHNKLAPQMLQTPRSWVDWEERQRAWWYVVILDRYVAAGSDQRSLFTEDPTIDTPIPVDDEAWKNGEIVPPERLSLASATSMQVSPFARVAQASHLLGRVIKHCNDQTRAFYLAQSLCLSAQMKLSDHHSCDSFSENMPIDIETAALLRECMDRSIAKMKENCSRVVSFAQVLMKLAQDSHLVCLSPLVLHCLYRTSVALSWMAMETSNEQYLIGKTICVNALQMMNTRWKAAGAYLELLNVAEREMGQETF